MGKKTLRDQFVVALERRGWTRVVDTKSSKYLVYAHPRYEGQFAYIGKSGAVRLGPTVARSTPIAEWRREMWLEEANA